MTHASLLASVAASALMGALASASVTPPSALDSFATVTAVAGWGTLLRNPAYTGPALRVRHAGTGAETDVAFDANGYVNDLPYGTDTRVVTIYDQWGSEHLTHVDPATSTLTLEKKPGDDGHHIVVSGGSIAMVAPTAQNAGAAWAVAEPLWLAVIERSSSAGLTTVFSVPAAAGGGMAWGLRQNGADLNWGLDAGTAANWVNTGFPAFANEFDGQWAVVIGDLTQRGNAIGWCNGVQRATTGWSWPVSYVDTDPLRLFNDAAGGGFEGRFVELHVFTRVSACSVADRQEMIGHGRDIETPVTATGWEATQFLQGFEGPTGTQPATDESPNPLALTFYGGAGTDTSQAAVGTASLALYRQTKYVAHERPPPIFGDFTVAGWVRFSEFNWGDRLFGDFDNTAGSWGIFKAYSPPRFFFRIHSFHNSYQTGFAPDLDTWYHLAMCRAGETIWCYVDGIQKMTMTNAGGIPLYARGDTTCNLGSPIDGFSGWLDEWIVTRQALYPGGVAFTPPVGAWPRG